MATLVVLWVAAYLVGAVPTTYLMAKAVRGIDLRAQGSGNVGASNLASQLGKFWYLPVVVIDLTRGGGPVALGYYLLGADGLAWGLAVTPLFTVTGNNWSPFLRFTGGRGVGVWAGGLLAMSPTLFAAALAVHLAGWMATRRSAEWLAVVMTVLPIACILWPSDWLLIISPEQLAVYAAAGAGLIFLKRILANGEPLPKDVPAGSVLLNRLFRDRDISDRQQWLSRQSEGTEAPHP